MSLRLGSPRFWSIAFGALAVLSFAAAIPLSVLSFGHMVLRLGPRTMIAAGLVVLCQAPAGGGCAVPAAGPR
jgi:hypothetical protein